MEEHGFGRGTRTAYGRGHILPSGGGHILQQSTLLQSILLEERELEDTKGHATAIQNYMENNFEQWVHTRSYLPIGDRRRSTHIVEDHTVGGERILLSGGGHVADVTYSVKAFGRGHILQQSTLS